MEGKKIIILFDVDETLTPARSSILPDMVETLDAVAAKGHHLGVVSGSDEVKVTDQVKQAFLDKCEYVFFENGLKAVRKGEVFSVQSFKKELGEENLKKLINFSLRHIADLDIPVKR